MESKKHEGDSGERRKEDRKKAMTISALRWSFLFVVLSASPSTAQKFDKAEMLRTVRSSCPAQMMQNKQFIDILLVGGGNLPNFCECLASRFSTQLDDADYGNGKAVTAKWTESQDFCLAVSLSDKK
jgi:hypothetical protein